MDDEERIYDAQGRILVADYDTPRRRDRYSDPLLQPRKPWRDEFRYSGDGDLNGWVRTTAEGKETFDRSGRLVTQFHKDGSAKTVQPVEYYAVQEPDQRPMLKWRPKGDPVELNP